MALAELAMEMVYIISVLRALGHQFASDEADAETSDPEAHKRIHQAIEEIFHDEVVAETDSQSARDLCLSKNIGNNSRHIDRKSFMMRELQRKGTITVKFIPTKDNSADMLTKAMDNQTFARHRAEVLNLDAA